MRRCRTRRWRTTHCWCTHGSRPANWGATPGRVDNRIVTGQATTWLQRLHKSNRLGAKFPMWREAFGLLLIIRLRVARRLLAIPLLECMQFLSEEVFVRHEVVSRADEALAACRSLATVKALAQVFVNFHHVWRFWDASFTHVFLTCFAELITCFCATMLSCAAALFRCMRPYRSQEGQLNAHVLTTCLRLLYPEGDLLRMWTGSDS